MKPQAALIAISTLGTATFIILFMYRNAPAFESTVLFAGSGLLYLLGYGLTATACLRALGGQPTGKGARAWHRPLLLLASGTLVYLFLDNTVLDYFQPVSLFDDVIAAWAVGWGALVLCLLLTTLQGTPPGGSRFRPLFALAVIAGLGVPLVGTLERLNTPSPNPLLRLHQDVFIGGEGGYRIYRIPALLVLPAGSTLANGTPLVNDRVLAFSEARRDGALDTGVIDLVMKHSDDGGETWSEQRLVCRHDQDGQRGKCGNATPVFDQVNGEVHLAYNLSGIGGPGHSAHIMRSTDGGISWGQATRVADDNLVFGPGHGIQKILPPQVGRLLLPGYLEDAAIVLFSDDNGANWQRSDKLDTGNETELAELSDGSVYLATRHRAPIGRPPQPHGRLIALSTDGGERWSATETDTQLPTPVCQASVLRYGSAGGLLFSNPAHHSARVNMTLRYSADDGKTWPGAITIYPGASGYSELATLSNGDVLVLYEQGKLAYSERISLARLGADQLPQGAAPAP